MVLKKSIAWKLIVPVAALVALCAVIAGSLISGLVRDGIEVRASEQIDGRVEAVREELNAIDELSLDKVHASMKLLQQRGKDLGTPVLGPPTAVGSEKVPTLFLGQTSQASNYSLVDQTTSMMGGTATLFVRRGDDFVRVATNVKNDDGSRAVGTRLDHSGKAIAAILNGSAFYGVVDILGAPYMTGYEPMQNRKGEIVGIWYVGYPLSALRQLGETIGESRILKGGFMAVVDDKGKVLFKSTHVSFDDVLNAIRSDGQSSDRSWDVLKQSFDPWGYLIVAAHRQQDISDETAQATMTVVVSTVVVALVLLSMIAALVSKTIRSPLRLLKNQMDVADLNSRLETARLDEIGDLQRSFDRFAGSVRETFEEINGAIDCVARGSKHISSSTEKMTAGAEKQTSQAGEVASAVEEMTKTIVENSRNASGTAETSRAFREVGAFPFNGRQLPRTALSFFSSAFRVNGFWRISDLGSNWP